MILQNYKKIVFLTAILGILLFTFIFFYNKEEAASAIQQWDWECQEEMEIMGTYVGGGEIPIGEAMDGTLSMAKEIIRNYDLMLPAAGRVVAAANVIYGLPLPDDCTADNCDTGCWMTYDETCWGEWENVTVDDKNCSSDPDECPFQNCTGSCADIVDNVCIPGVPCPPGAANCDCVTTPGTCCWDKITTCNCGPPGSCDISSPLCHEVMAGEVWCWGHEKCNEAQACSASCDPIVCPVGSTGPDCCWFLAPSGEYCWETPTTGQYCDCGDTCPPGEPFCFDVGTETKCWGDDECFDESLGGACEEVCIRNFDCDIIECNGNACPIDAIVELGDQRSIIVFEGDPDWGQIKNYANAINAEVQKAPGLQMLLEKARIGLKNCATPASGYEPAEEVQLLETLVSCQEAKWLRMLSEDQDNCYNSNFFCCLPIEK